MHQAAKRCMPGDKATLVRTGCAGPYAPPAAPEARGPEAQHHQPPVKGKRVPQRQRPAVGDLCQNQCAHLSSGGIRVRCAALSHAPAPPAPHPRVECELQVQPAPALAVHLHPNRTAAARSSCECARRVDRGTWCSSAAPGRRAAHVVDELAHGQEVLHVRDGGRRAHVGVLPEPRLKARLHAPRAVRLRTPPNKQQRSQGTAWAPLLHVLPSSGVKGVAP